VAALQDGITRNRSLRRIHVSAEGPAHGTHCQPACVSHSAHAAQHTASLLVVAAVSFPLLTLADRTPCVTGRWCACFTRTACRRPSRTAPVQEDAGGRRFGGNAAAEITCWRDGHFDSSKPRVSLIVGLPLQPCRSRALVPAVGPCQVWHCRSAVQRNMCVV
jgi:hypothetical protein